MSAEVLYFKAQILTLSTYKLRTVKSINHIHETVIRFKIYQVTHLQYFKLTVQHPLAQPSMYLKLCKMKYNLDD